MHDLTQGKDSVEALFQRATELLQHRQRVLIGLAGGPGSGKTTLTSKLVREWNERLGSDMVKMIPMDGFHYTLEELDKMDNPEEARARRGAEWTFDARLYASLVALVKKVTDCELFAPSFNHSVGAPVQDDIRIHPEHRILIFEGNYLLLNKHPWSLAANLYDIKAFLAVDPNTARKRVIQRHLQAGLCQTEAESAARTDSNDMVNLDFIQRNLLEPDFTLHQVDL
ncbi:nicotinamide riboside kinase [Schizosaccharomyces cryophilus OY26]|uniref:Nicotinamide riboside kinase n=1 Tax=Schizosaccharomyces cryophilus (strain OY26 / ATCC MYA-4695 / CBS 11777 / NBRC 106824 / NRRL Y48691) TaxID=653667 RepID=S9X791_SCHCR|nr:nicotinamide riboside kinase [Schizosaccharomyces cryophilus OY26]EPY49641.1 nicotinamide riboside kinase [Schizosaccharomyces cryophilus OY26]